MHMREQDQLFRKELVENVNQRMKALEDQLGGIRSVLSNENAELRNRCQELEHKLALANMAGRQPLATTPQQPMPGNIPLPRFSNIAGSGSLGSPLELSDSPLKTITQPKPPLPHYTKSDLPPPSNLFNLHQPQGCHVTAFSNTSSINNSRIENVHVHSAELAASATSLGHAAANGKLYRNPYTQKKKKQTGNKFFFPKKSAGSSGSCSSKRGTCSSKRGTNEETLSQEPVPKKQKFSPEALGEIDHMLVDHISKERRLLSTQTRKPDKLVWTSKDSEKLLKKGNQGAVSMIEVLRSLHSAAYFEADSFCGRGYHESCLGAKWAFNNVMELLQMKSKEEPEAFKFLLDPQPGPDKESLYHGQLNNAVKLLMDKLLELEGKTDSASQQEITVSVGGGPRKALDGKKKPGRKIAPTVAAMGTRIRSYKQEMQKAFPDLKNPPLRNRDEWEVAPGTPPDNHSLREFFVANRNGSNRNAAVASGSGSSGSTGDGALTESGSSGSSYDYPTDDSPTNMMAWN